MLGLSFRELGRLTPFEIRTRVKGVREVQLQRRRFEAQMVANLVNISGRTIEKSVTGDQLLGLDKKKRRKGKTREQLVADAKRKGRTYADYLREHGEA